MSAQLIADRMTDAQRQMVKNADTDDVVCTTDDRGGGLFAGLVTVHQGNGVSVTVARTEMIYNDDAEALDVAEEIVDAILSDGAEPEVVEELLPEEPVDEEPEDGASAGVDDEPLTDADGTIVEGGANGSDSPDSATDTDASSQLPPADDPDGPSNP